MPTMLRPLARIRWLLSPAVVAVMGILPTTVQAQPAVCCPPPNPAFGLNTSGSLRVLELDAHKVSITGPAGGIDGEVGIGPKGKLKLTGSQFISGTVHLASGATFSKSSSGTPPAVVPNADLSAEINSALNASADLAALPCDQSFATLSTTQTVTSTQPGLNVICVKDVMLNHETITLSGNLGDSFVINITGKFVNNGGHLVAGGSIEPEDVAYNVLGPGPKVAFIGGGGVTCCKATADGTILAVKRKIALRPGSVNGSVISGRDIAIVAGARVTCSSGACPVCGDGIVQPPEQCDPPGSFCRGGCNPATGICVDISCTPDCTCPPPVCGDGVIDPSEFCDPPGSPCSLGGICGFDCRGCIP